MVSAGNMVWSSQTWTAHAGLQYLYLAACAVVRLVHGTPADGFRLLNATVFSISAGTLAYVGLRLTHSRLLSALLVAVWGTAFVTQFLTFTLEDNLVFNTPAIVLLGWCAVRAPRWGWRDSVAGGLLAALAFLLSIQGILYLFPPLFLVACLPGRGRAGSLGRRTVDVFLVGFAFFVGVVLFTLFCLAMFSSTWRQSLAYLATRPTSTFPQTKAALIAQVFDVKAALRTIGIAGSLHLFRNHRPVTSTAGLVALGGVIVAVELAMLAASAWWSRRTKRWAAFFFAVVLLALTFLTSVYRDVEYAYLKRTDFLPVFLVLFLISTLGELSPSLRKQRVLALGLALLVAWQLATGLAWRNHEVASYETLDQTILGRRMPGYHGLPPEGAFLRHYRDLRAANPQACAFVFDFAELQHARWNPDISGSIWSELPRHFVLVSPSAMRSWPRPLAALDPAQATATLQGCEWLSLGARHRLGLPVAAAR